MTTPNIGRGIQEVRIEHEKEITSFSSLPVELIYEILSKLESLRDVANCSMVNKIFKKITEEPMYWTKLGISIQTPENGRSTLSYARKILSDYVPFFPVRKRFKKDPLSITFFHQTEMKININSEELPKGLEAFNSLRELSIFNTDIKIVPQEIAKLQKLRVLFLSKNNLESLPEEVGCLSSLEELWLTANEIKVLPKSLENLTKLKLFRADHNYLSEIPFSTKKMKDLQVFWVQGNSIETIPADLRRLEGKVALLSDGDALMKDHDTTFAT